MVEKSFLAAELIFTAVWLLARAAVWKQQDRHQSCFERQDGLYIGVDGCKCGWIAAVLDHNEVRLEKYCSVDAIVERYPAFNAFLIDMAIGLRNSLDQKRPDDIFAENAWYFRNSLVRANYNDLKKGVHETTEYLELFLRNLLLNENHPLHNRTLHISGTFKETKKPDIGEEKPDIKGLGH